MAKLKLQDLSEVTAFLDGDTLEVPVYGSVYIVEDVDGETGLYCQVVCEAAEKAARTERARADRDFEDDDTAGGEDDDDIDYVLPTDGDERTMYHRVLGETLTEMLADGVKWRVIRHVGQTALMWIVYGEETAVKYWQSGGTRPPEGAPANRQERRAKAKARAAARGDRTGSTSRQRTGTGAATTTPRPTRTNGTKPRKTAQAA